MSFFKDPTIPSFRHSTEFEAVVCFQSCRVHVKVESELSTQINCIKHYSNVHGASNFSRWIENSNFHSFQNNCRRKMLIQTRCTWLVWTSLHSFEQIFYLIWFFGVSFWIVLRSQWNLLNLCMWHGVTLHKKPATVTSSDSSTLPA